jgi:hypothetical protein
MNVLREVNSSQLQLIQLAIVFVASGHRIAEMEKEECAYRALDTAHGNRKPAHIDA